ncbi:hypothetical protein Dvar_48950 [Desulfosarcina variabilis str. Montpellier]|uniref:hypothetical protein n=1 Tax=Desulfosarcina variabilis TaxID=2300 RepID=UPI003AFA1FDD
MDVITAISTALALGGAAGLKDTTTQVVKDGYAALKRLLVRKLPAIIPSLEQIEQAPDSPARSAALKENLVKANVDKELDLLAQTEMFLKLIVNQAPELVEVIGVSLEDIKGASLSIADIRSSGSGVKVTKVEIDGDINIKGVRAGSEEPNDPNA